MKVTLEPVVFVMRFHQDDNAVLGDPYVSSATVTIDDGGIANIRGFSSDTVYSTDAWRAADAALAEIGAKGALWYRKKKNKNGNHKITEVLRKVRTVVKGTDAPDGGERAVADAMKEPGP